MSTVVFVHAHPDDEASQSAGSMARAVSEGHRVVLVVATNGDHGDAPDDLAEGETVVERRRAEAAASNAVIGTHRVAFLGYGHPDHVKVHAVTKRAAELAGTPRYLEGSMNRDAMIRSHQAAMAAGHDVGEWDPSQPMDDGNPLGSLESELHWACDVSEFLEVKRSALKAHASQSDAQGMLQMPVEMFAVAFAWEHYIEPGRPDGMVDGWFLGG